MSLLAEYNLPFAIALGLMLLFAILQFVGIGDFDGEVDLDLDIEADGASGLFGGLTTLLGIGKVPFFIWLVIQLFLFAGIGISIQSLAESLTGSPLYVWLAALASAVVSVPFTSALVRPLANIIPQDESSAVGLDSLLGKRAVVTMGRAARGHPARAKVYDVHGHAHYVMVEPHEDDSEMSEGDDVLLVRRERQAFFGVPLSERTLSPMMSSTVPPKG